MKLKKRNENLSEKILHAIEELWEICELPQGYRKFLLECNAGTPEKGSFIFKDESDGSCVSKFFGFIKGYNSNLLLKQKYAGDRVPQNMLPIADDVYGNLILLSIKGADRGKIYFWDHEMEADAAQGEVPDYSNLTLISDSFDEFINSLHSVED